MKWIEYDYVCNENKGIKLHKKVEYNEENLAIAKAEACDGKYDIIEDAEELAIKPTPIKLGGTGATNAGDARRNLNALHRGGGSMTGDLDMSGNTIKKLKAPVDDGDAVPKFYSENADNLKSGTVKVARGGTGKSSVTSGNFLVGNGTGAMREKTPAEVLSLIGALPAVLTEGKHYGDELPAAGTPGRLFFKKVTG